MAIALPAGTWARGRVRLLSLPKTSPMLMNWAAVSLVFVVTIVALAVPLIAPDDPLVPAGMPLQAPGKSGFLLGSDAIGRDSSRTLPRAHVPAGNAIAISARLPFDAGDLVQIAGRPLEPDIELAL